MTTKKENKEFNEALNRIIKMADKMKKQIMKDCHLKTDKEYADYINNILED